MLIGEAGRTICDCFTLTQGLHVTRPTAPGPRTQPPLRPAVKPALQPALQPAATATLCAQAEAKLPRASGAAPDAVPRATSDEIEVALGALSELKRMFNRLAENDPHANAEMSGYIAKRAAVTRAIHLGQTPDALPELSPHAAILLDLFDKMKSLQGLETLQQLRDTSVQAVPERDAQNILQAFANHMRESIVETASKKSRQLPVDMQGAYQVVSVLYDQALESTSQADREVARKWLTQNAAALKVDRTFSYSEIRGFSVLTPHQQSFAMREDAKLGFLARHGEESEAPEALPVPSIATAKAALQELKELRASEQRIREALLRNSDGLRHIDPNDKVLPLHKRLELQKKLEEQLERVMQQIEDVFFAIPDPAPTTGQV